MRNQCFEAITGLNLTEHLLSQHIAEVASVTDREQFLCALYNSMLSVGTVTKHLETTIHRRDGALGTLSWHVSDGCLYISMMDHNNLKQDGIVFTPGTNNNKASYREVTYCFDQYQGIRYHSTDHDYTIKTSNLLPNIIKYLKDGTVSHLNSLIECNKISLQRLESALYLEELSNKFTLKEDYSLTIEQFTMPKPFLYKEQEQTNTIGDHEE